MVTLDGTNAIGEKIYILDQVIVNKQISKKINISFLPSGLYWLTARGKDGVLAVQKIIKQ